MYTVSSGGGGGGEVTYPLKTLEAKKKSDESIQIGEHLLQFEKKQDENLIFSHKEPYTNYGGAATYFTKSDSIYIEYRGGGQHSFTIYKLKCKKK